MDLAQSKCKKKLFGHKLDLGDIQDSSHEPPAKRTKNYHTSTDTSPALLSADNDLPATPFAAVHDKLTEHAHESHELQNQYKDLKSLDQDLNDPAWTNDKAKHKEVAVVKDPIKTFAASRHSEIDTGPSSDPETQVTWLKEEITFLRDENSVVTTTKNRQAKDIVQLKKKVVQLKGELASVTKERDYIMRCAAANSKTEPQQPARRVETSSSPTGASQTTRSSGKFKKQAEPEFCLTVLTHDKTFGFVVASEKSLSLSAVPDDLLKMGKLALRMAAGNYNQSDVHIVFERDVSVPDKKRYVPLPSKRYVPANDRLYEDWSKEVRSEHSRDGTVAAAAHLPAVRAYIWKGEDDKARSLFKSVLTRL